MSQKLSVLALLVSLLALFMVWTHPADYAAPKHKETAFERVMRTNTLRCGYIVYPPGLIKDLNTGKMSGISYDIMTRLGRDLGFKIVWTEEVGTVSMIEGLETGRYDLVCTSVWAESGRGKRALFTTPLYFTEINAYARSGDSRFKDRLASLNDPKNKIATIDGGLAAVIARQDFPKAQTYSLPELTDFSDLFLGVTSRKADVTFSEPAQIVAFDTTHPQALQNLSPNHPVRLFPNAFMVAMGEDKLAAMLNNAILNLQYNGEIDTIIKSYEQTPHEYRRVALPIQP